MITHIYLLRDHTHWFYEYPVSIQDTGSYNENCEKKIICLTEDDDFWATLIFL